MKLFRLLTPELYINKSMKPFSERINVETTIVQPTFFKRVFELRTSEELLWTMKFPKIFSSLAEIEGLEQQWEIYKPSIWRSTVEVRQKGFQLPIAKYVGERWGQGGTIDLPKGDRLKHSLKIWKGINEITTESGKLLVTFQRKGFIGTTVHVRLLEKSELIDKYPWVIMLVWYVIQQQRQHAATH